MPGCGARSFPLRASTWRVATRRAAGPQRNKSIERLSSLMAALSETVNTTNVQYCPDSPGSSGSSKHPNKGQSLTTSFLSTGSSFVIAASRCSLSCSTTWALHSCSPWVHSTSCCSLFGYRKYKDRRSMYLDLCGDTEITSCWYQLRSEQTKKENIAFPQISLTKCCRKASRTKSPFVNQDLPSKQVLSTKTLE